MPNNGVPNELIPNPHLKNMPQDYLYHLALGTSTHDLPSMFNDVQFICVGGTPSRMKSLALYLSSELGESIPTGFTLDDITGSGHRYSMYKVGPVLCVNHGMGNASLSILLHELFKLIKYSKCKEPVTILRVGTSGGLGCQPGSVVVSNGACDGMLRPIYELVVLGKVKQIPCSFDQDLIKDIITIGRTNLDASIPIITGITMCANDFYEGQGRLDGAFCSYTESEKMEYLHRLSEAGVANIEMESLVFSAMCAANGTPAAIICCTLLDRLQGDQIHLTAKQYEEFQLRPQRVAASYIKCQLGITITTGNNNNNNVPSK